MENEIHLHYFGHYFDLFVAFTFAYAGWDAFKTAVNKVALKETESYKRNKGLIENLESKVDVQVRAGGHIESKIHQKTNEAKKCLNILNFNEVEAEFVYNGKKFEMMFYTIGAIYLIAIVLAAFQSPQLNKPIFVFLFLTTANAYYFQFRTIRSVHSQAINLSFHAIYEQILHELDAINKSQIRDPKTIKELRRESLDLKNTAALKRALITFCFLFITLLVFFSVYPLPIYFKGSILFNNYSFDIRTIIKSGIVLFVLALPIAPYYAFFNRKNYVLKYYEDRFECEAVKLEGLLNDITSEQKSQLLDGMNDKISNIVSGQ